MAANLVYMTKTAWQNLLTSIKTKAGYVGTLTASQAKTAVDNIQTGGGSGPDHYVSFDYNTNNQVISAEVYGIYMIQQRQFYNMASLETVSVDATTYNIGQDAFNGCHELLKLAFPGLIRTLGSAAFRNCWALTECDITTSEYISIPSNCFASDMALNTLILRRTDGVCPLSSSNAFTDTPIASGTGTIYVPQALISSYQTAANWSAIYTAGTQFVAIEGSIYE